MCHATIKRISALALTLTAAACAVPAPSQVDPVFPVASRYADAGDVTPQAGIDPVDFAWETYFADPRMRSLIAQALQNNRDLRSAALRVDEARAAFGIQRAGLWPAIDASAGGDRLRLPADGGLIGQPILATQYQIGLGLVSWEIDFWGRLRNLREAALESFLASAEARRAVAITLVEQVAIGDLTLRELDERIALAQASITSRQESVRIFRRRVAVGSTARLALLQVETLLTQAQSLDAQLRQSRASAWQALTVLVGQPLDLSTAAPPLDQGPILVPLRPGLPSDLLRRRPDIIAAEHQLGAARANIGAARAAFFPRVTLTSAAGSTSPELDHLFAWDTRAWIFAPAISLPLFDGDRRRNNLTLAQVRRELAIASYEKAVQNAFRDVSDALSARKAQTELVAIAVTARDVQQARARLAQIRYDRGATTFLDVLDAERDRLAAEQQLVHSRGMLLSTEVSLYAALGGGTAGPISPSPSTAEQAIHP